MSEDTEFCRIWTFSRSLLEGSHIGLLDLLRRRIRQNSGSAGCSVSAIGVVFAFDLEAEDNDNERREKTNVEQTVF
jgi:hypothetical protein